MFGLRMAQIKNNEDEPSPPPSIAEDNRTDRDSTKISINIPHAGGTVEGSDGLVNVGDAGDRSVAVAQPVADVVTQVSSASGGSAIASAINTDRGRELMAGMDNVGLKVTGFTSDARNAVSGVVKNAVTGAIEQCQLSVRNPDIEPIMFVELEMNGENLILSAKLVAVDSEKKVRVWERSGTVSKLTKKATSTGILPTGLSRDVTTFFKSLRLEFNDARRQFPS